MSQSMNRIVLIGSGGSGKSTLARQIGEKRKLQVWHLDQLFWNPGWVPTNKEEQRLTQQSLMEEERWIMDGNYNGTMDLRLEQADTIIFIDLPRVVCLYRVLKRNWQYRNRTRPDMAEGCEERLDLGFLKWVWSYPTKHRPVILKRLRNYAHEKTIIVLKSRKDVRLFFGFINERGGVI